MEINDLVTDPDISLRIVDGGLQVRSRVPLSPAKRLLIKQVKYDLINLLLNGPGDGSVPPWCDPSCQRLLFINFSDKGDVGGCTQSLADYEQWSRLDKMKKCPAKKHNEVSRGKKTHV
jgi:hypothetical protein